MRVILTGKTSGLFEAATYITVSGRIVPAHVLVSCKWLCLRVTIINQDPVINADGAK
jgi:hypothetical protein